MKIKIFLILFSIYALNLTLFAQDVELTLDSQGVSGNITWYLKGKSDLPDETRIVARLYLGNLEIPRSKRTVYSKNNNFLLDYGPMKGKIPSGKYIWEGRIYFENSKKKNFKKSFFYGTESQQRKEIKEEANFLKEQVKEAKNFIVSIDREESSILDEQVSNEKVKEWSNSIYQRFENLQNSIKKGKSEYFFVRSPRNFKNLDSVLKNLETFVYLKIINILNERNISIPKQYSKYAFSIKDQKSMVKDITKSRRIAEEVGSLILSSLPISENLTEKHLSDDITWFNEIFRGLSQLYKKNIRNLDKNSWEKEVQSLEQELEDYQNRTYEYENSPLVSKYPEMMKNFKNILNGWKNLKLSYTLTLYGKFGEIVPEDAKKIKDPPEKIIIELQESFEKIVSIVNEKNKKDGESRKKAYDNASESLETLSKLVIDLSSGIKKSKIEEFSEWKQNFEPKISEITQKTESFKTQYPELRRVFLVALQEVKTTIKLQEQMLNGDSNPTILAKIKDSFWSAKLIIKEIENKMPKN